jgi:hypothetical protein
MIAGHGGSGRLDRGREVQPLCERTPPRQIIAKPGRCGAAARLAEKEGRQWMVSASTGFRASS